MEAFRPGNTFGKPGRDMHLLPIIPERIVPDSRQRLNKPAERFCEKGEEKLSAAFRHTGD